MVHIPLCQNSGGVSRELNFARGATEYHEYCLNILIYSRVFWPCIGGVETMMEILAEEFTVAGHQVKVVTQVASETERDRSYEVVRLPTLKSSVQLLRWSDVCLCANVSLRGLPPMIMTRTPLVISHQGYDGSSDRFQNHFAVQENRDLISAAISVAAERFSLISQGNRL